MLMDILMEALMSMDDESLDYVLESCDDEELEIIDSAMEMKIADRNNPHVQAYTKFSRGLSKGTDDGQQFDIVDNNRGRVISVGHGASKSKPGYDMIVTGSAPIKTTKDGYKYTGNYNRVEERLTAGRYKSGDATKKELRRRAKNIVNQTIKNDNNAQVLNNIGRIAKSAGKSVKNFVSNDYNRTVKDMRNLKRAAHEANDKVSLAAANGIQRLADKVDK